IYNGYPVCADEAGEICFLNRKTGYTHTDTEWSVTPASIYWGSRFLYEKYHLPLYITENGMACHDSISPDGCVHDPNRIEFLDAYIGALQKAADEGADIRGYFVWTLMDNFEWNKGYSKRFGLIYVDFPSQLRIVKDSAYWYQKVIESNGANLTVNRKARQILFLEQNENGEVGVTSWITEGAYAGLTLDELLHRAPELFGGVMQPPAKTEMITLEIEGEASFLQDQPYLYMTVTQGDGLLNGHYIRERDHFILPCGFGTAYMQGSLTLLVSARVPLAIRNNCGDSCSEH
ncbi:MAG: family 1 glycosylhydrolase, partial [Lachnospiraceae bacterium]|nr:family 1 glycosylhydrolase [Lachnospiraceae bacterium]